MKKSELIAAGITPILCPVCGKGQVDNSYAIDREHALDCRLQQYLAKVRLWEGAKIIS